MSNQVVTFVLEESGGGAGAAAGAAPPASAAGGRAARQIEETQAARNRERDRASQDRTKSPDRTASGGQAERSRTDRALQDSSTAKAIRLASESFGKLWERFADAVQSRLIRQADDFARRAGLDKFFGSLAKRFKDYFDALGNPNPPAGWGRAAGGRTTVVDSYVKGGATETKSRQSAGGSAGGGGHGLSEADIRQLRELGGDDLVEATIRQLSKGGAKGGRAAGAAEEIALGGGQSLIIPAGRAAGGAAAGAGGSGGLITTAAAGSAEAAGTGLTAGGAGGLATAGGGAAAGGAALASNPVGWAILAALAVVVVTIGAAVVATKALVTVNNALKARFGEVSERLKPFSARIQVADARAGVAKLQQDIEFAGRLGGGLGRFNQAEARIERAIDRVGNAINGPLLNFVVPFVERAAGLLDGVARGFDALTTIADRVGLLKSPLAELIRIENNILGFTKDEALKLPPEADILGIFQSEPFLTVSWKGRTFGADEGRELGGADKKTFANPLPVVGIP